MLPVFKLIHPTSIDVAFLRDNDNPSCVRFISDNVRLENYPDAGTYLNTLAGESFLRYLRGRVFNAPVLICACYSIDSTRYVDEYWAAGSTRNPSICLDYISNLAARRDDDNEYRGFHPY